MVDARTLMEIIAAFKAEESVTQKIEARHSPALQKRWRTSGDKKGQEMTKKEAQAYVSNAINWEMIEETEHMRLCKLKHESISYYRIELRRVVNWVEVYSGKATMEDDFRVYNHFDDVDGMIGHDVRPSEIVEKVWRASK